MKENNILEKISKPVLLFGAGGLAADIADIVQRAWNVPVAGLVVDRPSDEEQPEGEPPILQWDDVSSRGDSFICVAAIGRPHRRPFLEKAEAAGFHFATLIDPSAQIFPSAVIEPGCVIGAGSIVAARARIGRHVFLNRGVAIGHHTQISEFCSIQAGAGLGGFCHIEEETEIGIGATVIDRITIGARSFVGAGSVVVKDCAPDSKSLGNPARERSK
jgi:sugar O-acyltransferase (sialic acid O-acetyltransferase NeuD family)